MTGRDEHEFDDGPNVVYLPSAGRPVSAGSAGSQGGGTAQTHQAAEGEVIEAELVDGPGNSPARVEPRDTWGTRPLVSEQARQRMAAGAVELSHRVGPPVATGGKAAVRALLHVGQGTRLVAARWRDTHGASRYERRMRVAEMENNEEMLRYWQEADVAEKDRRHERMMDWADTPVKWLKAAAAGLLGLAGLLLVLGVVLAVDSGEFADVVAPIGGVIDAVAFLIWFLTAYGLVLLGIGTAAGLLYLWDQGRKHGQWAPSWLQSPGQQAETAESYAVINEDMLTRALGACGVSLLGRALKAGESLYFDVLPRQQGGGTYVQVRLPMGVVAADFLHPRTIERLAGNLGRHKHEVYPQRQPDADARVLDLWIADPGTMDRPAPGWPLLHEGEFDVFRDRIRWGVTMRGEQVEQGALNRHVLVGAVSKQGKTATLRIHALAMALDPTVELRVADLKGDGDWSMFAPRAHTLIEGGADEQAEATCQMLEDLVTEMQDRYERKRAAGIRGEITRDISRQPGSGFHPIYAYIDECQVLYQAEHPIGGTKADARAWRAAKRLHDQARAVNIHLLQATQRPDPTAIPVMVREGAHVRIALYVPNTEAAKMVLADAADMGARPQDLRPGRDAGTFVATGEFDGIGEGMAFLIVKSHYVSTQDAYLVIDRAMEILAHHGRTVTPQHVEDSPAAPVDHLRNIEAALGEHTRLRTQEVLQLLAERNREVYGHWTFADLKKALPECAKPYKSDGEMKVSADRVRQAITESDNETGSHDASPPPDGQGGPRDAGSSP